MRRARGMEGTQVWVKNVRYVTSQPWPFPHSLMMALYGRL